MTVTDNQFCKIAKATPVSEMVPFTFTSCNTRIDSFTCDCAKCGQEIPQEHIRGESNSHNKHTIEFIGHGICYACRTLTPVNVRFADDGSFMTKTETGWNRNMITQQVDPGLVVVAWRNFRSLVARLRA